jgi:hypothetical protein
LDVSKSLSEEAATAAPVVIGGIVMDIQVSHFAKSTFHIPDF